MLLYARSVGLWLSAGWCLACAEPVCYGVRSIGPAIWTRRIEVTPQALPAAIVVAVNVRRAQSRARQPRDVVRLEPVRTAEFGCNRLRTHLKR